jgi:hypothetical protein
MQDLSLLVHLQRLAHRERRDGGWAHRERGDGGWDTEREEMVGGPPESVWSTIDGNFFLFSLDLMNGKVDANFVV